MADRPATRKRWLGTWSGVGMVVANMIGAGVFVSAGYMAQDLGPGHILLAWLVGAVLAMAGALAYAAVSQLVPRSGGEYRYLSELFHPALGTLAGWASLLLGFSAPIAVDAGAAGAFAATIVPLHSKVVAVAIVLVLTLLHASRMRLSVWTQNSLVSVKAILLVGFVLLGLFKGAHQWPTWQPAHQHGAFPLYPFMNSLFYIAFAFSGWNAAAYAAEEFRRPARDVPRAMVIGCLLVGLLYLVVNWVFVANLTPARATAVFNYESARITLGHLVTHDLVGALGARLMSGLMIIAFLSAISAMTFVGPRVYAAMAHDGFLPRWLSAAQGRPPAGAVLLQGALALLLVLSHSVQQVLQNVGAILTLFSALTALSLFKAWLSGRTAARPAALSLVGAAVYVLSAAWILFVGFKRSPTLVLWVGAIAVVAMVAYCLVRRKGAG